MAALQIKLAQLTSNQQPGQSEQPAYYQQIDEQNQQTYTISSQDPNETSQIQQVNISCSSVSSPVNSKENIFVIQEHQQSQLNSPTVQMDINQLKLTPTQPSSAVSTPVIEQNETVFPQQSDQANIASNVVQPKQLSDLEQELAKIHQKRYNKDQQQPLSVPPVEQLLSNNVLGIAPNTQAIQTLPIINTSQSSHTEQQINNSVNISIPNASADFNDNNTLNIQTQTQAARKISRFQVSVVSEATPSIQVQPQDSVRTQFMQANATTSVVSSTNPTVDEQRYDYGGMNFQNSEFQNFTNSTGGNGELSCRVVESIFL